MDYRVVLILFLAIVRGVNAQFGQGTIFQILNNTKGLQKVSTKLLNQPTLEISNTDISKYPLKSETIVGTHCI